MRITLFRSLLVLVSIGLFMTLNAYLSLIHTRSRTNEDTPDVVQIDRNTDYDDGCFRPNNPKRDLLRYPVKLKDMGYSPVYHPDPGATRCGVSWEWTGNDEQADALIYNTLHHHDDTETEKGNLHVVKRKCQDRVLLSVESPLYYPLMLNATSYGFNIAMDFRRDSDVPIPYVPSNYMQMVKKKPLPTNKKNNDVYITGFMSNCIAINYRDEVVQELQQYVPVHNYGSCDRNAKLPPLEKGQGWVGQKLDVIRKYKFTLAFENSNYEDYVTEKFFQPLMEGSVPVYFGAKNILDFAPNEKAVINVADFNTVKELADYLIYLNSNDTAYEEHLAWKYDRSTWSDRYLQTINLGRQDGHCRLAMYLAGLYTNPLKRTGRRY